MARKHWHYRTAAMQGENKCAGTHWLSREMAKERQVSRFAGNQPRQRTRCTSSPSHTEASGSLQLNRHSPAVGYTLYMHLGPHIFGPQTSFRGHY